MYVVYYCESKDRYSVSRLDSAKRCGLNIISIHETYRKAEKAAAELARKKGNLNIEWAKNKK